ncbi:MAG: signal peptidase II [Myxococcota bacterium]|jgi:signal peptidase II|nr:signal peptidase II [Myxococcota bacterium]
MQGTWSNAKIITLAVILISGVIADQATKIWAETVLASPRYPDHSITITVEDEHDGKPLREYLGTRLSSTPEEELDAIAGRYVSRGEQSLGPNTVLRGGDELELRQRSITVIEGYWDFHYARNPGAVWSFMATAPDGFRQGFLITTTILAIGLMLFFLYRAEPQQRRLILSLSMVLSGAVGNLIDRIRFGYVIDFIAWHYHDKYWPTFNIADAFITVGVALMAIDILFSGKSPAKPQAEQSNEKESSEATEGSKAKAKGVKAKDAKPTESKA